LRRAGLLLAAGVGTYLLILLANYPAARLAAHLQQQYAPLVIHSVSGSVFSGSAARVERNALVAGPVHWTFRPSGLLKGRLEYRLQGDLMQEPFEGHVGIDLAGRIHLQEVQAELDPANLVIPTGTEGLSLIPGAVALATLDRQSGRLEGLGLVLKRAVDRLRVDYDYVLIDCPPILGVLLINALAACERLIIPVQTEFLAIKGLERMQHTLQMVTKARPVPLEVVVVPTFFDQRTRASIESLAVLRRDFAAHLWHGVVPIDTRFRDASQAGLPPAIFDPRTHGVQAYAQLLEVFFTSHDPTTLNRQGPDSGRQYRSAIFYADEAEKAAARAHIDGLVESGVFGAPIVTTLEKLDRFYPAEAYHQDFAERNPLHPYIRAHAAPKVEKARKEFPDLTR